jgi:CRP/FNR family transcriptional regulator, cyclic AMP receptor protein
MAEPVHVDLMAAKSRLQFLNTNDWILILDKAKCLNFRKEETLIQHGKQIEMVFMVTDGRATVKTSFGVVIARIGPGEICGEMSFLESTSASASVIADVAMAAYGVAWRDLQSLFDIYPRLASRFYRSLAVSLSQRLRGQISRG